MALEQNQNVDRKVIADIQEPEETRVAILEDGRLAEVFIERMWDRQKAGEIYKAKVDSVLPGISAAFISIGEGRNAFLYLNDAQGMEIVPGQELVVQVSKAARKNKGARVTPRLSLPGRYLVLVPGGREAGVSRRIADEDERRRLRRFAKALKGEDFGVIIRTAAEGVDEEALTQDVQSLLTLWHEIEHDAQLQPAPCLLYKDLGLLGRVLRDEVPGGLDEIIVNNEEEFQHVRNFAEKLYKPAGNASSGAGQPQVSLYRGLTPIFECYGIEAEIDQALNRKVWLKSGAYLVIEHTEALTVIDVNTGKFVGGTKSAWNGAAGNPSDEEADPFRPNMRHTTLATNLEAAEEIARQLRLRSIGGIIVVDFIDMEFEEDRRKLLECLEAAFRSDRLRARVHSMTQLGLVELTRKRRRPSLRDLLTRGCPFCGDTGWVLREDTVAMSIKRFLRKIARANSSEATLLQAHAEVARYIFETYLPMWQKELRQRIWIAGMPDFAWNKYRVEFQGEVGAAEHRARQLERGEEGIIVYRIPAPEGV